MKLNKSFHIYGLMRRPYYQRLSVLFLLVWLVQACYAQSDAAPDFMRSVGKIYVVAAVTLIILAALFIYMIIIDRKISRIEKRHKNE